MCISFFILLGCPGQDFQDPASVRLPPLSLSPQSFSLSSHRVTCHPVASEPSPAGEQISRVNLLLSLQVWGGILPYDLTSLGGARKLVDFRFIQRFLIVRVGSMTAKFFDIFRKIKIHKWSLKFILICPPHSGFYF